MIDFHLLETCSIGIVHEVEAVATWCSKTQDLITFVVFKNEVDVLRVLLNTLSYHDLLMREL